MATIAAMFFMQKLIFRRAILFKEFKLIAFFTESVLFRPLANGPPQLDNLAVVMGRHANKKSDENLSKRLPQIAEKVKELMGRAKEKAIEALELQKEAGEMLHEAEAICQTCGISYKAWVRDKAHIQPDKARELIQMHIQWNDFQTLISPQSTFDFMNTRKVLMGFAPKEDIQGAAVDETVPIPEEAYIPPVLPSVGFEYPEEEPSESPYAAGMELLDVLFAYIIPAKLTKREHWRTFVMRFVAISFLYDKMPQNVSLREACRALGLSHATMSKYTRQLADKLGIHSRIQKREWARRRYSEVQKQNHWRNRSRAAEETAVPSGAL